VVNGGDLTNAIMGEMMLSLNEKRGITMIVLNGTVYHRDVR